MSTDKDGKSSEKPEESKTKEAPPIRLTTDPMKLNKDHKDKGKEDSAL